MSDGVSIGRRWALVLAAVLLAGALSYSNTFRVPFHFDDRASIVDNPLIRDLSYFADLGTGEYYYLNTELRRRFVGYLSFALNYKLHGLEVEGYHVVNLLVHLTCAGLLYWLVMLMLDGHEKARAAALVAAAVFALHPVQTQAVTYIVQRLASLSAMFVVASVALFVASLRAPQSLRRGLMYSAAIVAALLAAKTKENAVVLPVLALVAQGLAFSAPLWARALTLAPFFVAAALVPYGLMDSWAVEGGIAERLQQATSMQAEISRPEYMLTQLRVMATYLRLLVFPVGQNVDYDYAIQREFFTAQTVGAFILLTGIITATVMLWRRHAGSNLAARLIVLGSAWYFIAHIPESSVFPIADVIFEHRLYLPMAGVAMAAGGAVVWVDGLLAGASARKVFWGVVVGTLCCLAVATYMRNEVWASEYALWSDAASKSPAKARPHVNLGDALDTLARPLDAIAHYERAIQIDPKNVVALSNLGGDYYEVGRYGDAESVLERVVALAPGYAPARVNLGLALMKLNRPRDAAVQFYAATKLDPGLGAGYYHLERAMNVTGMTLEELRLLDLAK